MSNQLPRGWTSVQVGDVFSTHGGGTPSRGTAAYWNGNIPWLSSGDIKATSISESTETITKRGLEESAARLCRKGSVLVVVRSGILKHTLPVALLEREAAINQDIKAFDSGDDSLNVRLALAWSASARQLLAGNREGTTVQSVKLETLREFDLPIPPPSEQRRIVAKLTELLGKVDACQQRLAKIPVLLKRFRQSVLAAACSGRLTADRREEKREIESAADFVRRVQVERKAAYDRDCLAATTKGERKPKRPKNEFTAIIDEKADGLPDLWCVTRIGDISDCLDHIRVPINKTERLRRQGTIPYYGANGQVGFIDDFLFDEELVLVVEDETFIGREKPFSYVIKGETWVNNHAHVLRALGGMPTDFLNVCLSYYDFVPLTSGTTGRRKLTQEGLVDAPLPIAPLAEQQEIVRRVEGLFALADQIESRLAQARAQVDKLTPSLLAKAFRGELVPQDPTDEPAEQLLERLRSAASSPALPCR